MNIPFILLLFILMPILISKRKQPNAIRLPPGPTPLPFIGCLLQMLFNRPTFRWIHQLMDEMNTRIICVKLGGLHYIAISSPEIACEFLKKQDQMFASRPVCLSAELTSSYLAAALSPLGEQWKKMRRILTSDILSPAVHRWLLGKRMEEADHLLRYVYNQCQNSPLTGGIVNVRIVAQHYCGNVARKLIFGKRFFGRGMEDGGPGEEEIEHVGALFTILNYLYSFCISDFLPFFRRKVDLDGHEKIMRKATESVRKYQDPLVDERIRQWQNGTKGEQNDLLDILINVNNASLTAEEIKAQIVELMIASIDNPSNAVEWALAEMINEPRILRRATEEVDQVVGRGRLVQESDLPNLNYIKACLKEAFRLHPIAPFNVPHVAVDDVVVAGYFIPKGSHVILSRPGLGRNPDVWDDPMVFNPDRHLQTDGKEVFLTDHELKMLSFSTGRRGCAGVLLGSTMTTMLMARLVHGFSWHLPPDMPKIDLVEAHRELLMAKPLCVIAKPRLAHELYPRS